LLDLVNSENAELVKIVKTVLSTIIMR